MTLKRLILSLLTFFAIARVFLSLGGSLTEPQIQSKLELYQTNLILYASELQLETENDDLSEAIAKGLGDDPTAAAIKKYDRTRQQAIEERELFQTKLNPAVADSKERLPVETQKVSDREITTLRQQIKKQVTDLNRFIDEIDLKRGVLAATKDNLTSAQEIWQQLITRINDREDEYAQTALVLSKLWDKNPEAMNNAATIIQDNLDSWFRDRALAKLYTVTDDSTQLATLNDTQQKLASQAIVKLALVSGIPVFGGLIGFILLVSLLVQLLFKKEKSLLATNSNLSWETPWDWEITWQVIIIGFFFVGQFILPLILGVVGFNLTEASLRMKALYVLFTYILMAAGGIFVLYLSIKPYLPLSQEWFKTKIRDRWFWWGFGGYLVAIPCVLIISLINQQIWQGQGGSNPLLYLALQAQDRVALTIFLVTASIAAPVFEEIIFRGFLLPSLTRYLSVTTSIVVSGSLFAIAHLSLAEFLPLATLGIILGVVYTRSRNILAPMLLHSLWNSGTLLSLFVLGSGT
jgi:uncharacterized protein